MLSLPLTLARQNEAGKRLSLLKEDVLGRVVMSF